MFRVHNQSSTMGTGDDDDDRLEASSNEAPIEASQQAARAAPRATIPNPYAKPKASNVTDTLEASNITDTLETPNNSTEEAQMGPQSQFRKPGVARMKANNNKAKKKASKEPLSPHSEALKILPMHLCCAGKKLQEVEGRSGRHHGRLRRRHGRLLLVLFVAFSGTFWVLDQDSPVESPSHVWPPQERQPSFGLW